MTSKRVISGAFAGAALLITTACSASVSTGGSLEETELEKQVSSLLEKQVGHRPDKIDCPGDLTAKEGTTMRCTLAAGGDELGVTVTVTEVKGTRVNFNLEVDES
ncbi:DUF4333 domain-containing protein [Nocardioides sp. NPDC000445]|uniref:DUF4333 domain-containing protein n=1 Tax=Nocardioides sp. NPDC000445 TaxID=3154257 RepID=UPI003323C89D